MNIRTLKCLFLVLTTSIGGVAHSAAPGSEPSAGYNVLKMLDLSDKFGNYKLAEGDLFCEQAMTLQNVELVLDAHLLTAVEFVPTEIAEDDYLWRQGLSTLFVNINGKKVSHRSMNSRNQVYRSEYRATFEEAILTGSLEYKNSFALIRLDKESIVTTLDFNGEPGTISYRQVETDEDKHVNTVLCEYVRAD